jgi:hypothetical protein
MALPVWPAITYRPQSDATQVEQLLNPPTKTNVEDGPAIIRQWSSGNWTRIKYRILFTHAAFDTFYTFYKTTLGRGAQRFTMPVGRFNMADPWPNKTVFIEPDSLSGPRKSGEGHVTVDFILNVLDW